MSIVYYDEGSGVWGSVNNMGFGDFSQYRCWRVNEKYHRLDGPAREWNDGDFEYFLKGKHVRHHIRQQILIGSSVNIGDNVGIVIKHIDGVFYEALLGNKKILIAKVLNEY